jgi:hypothetical protein
MPNPNNIKRRTQHCENHYLGWAIAGTLIAVGIVTGTIYYLNKTDYRFPSINEDVRQIQSQTNDVNLLTDPRWPRQPGKLRQ